jgi:hypothetical protein
MRLLITNDDGIDSALLHALVGTLRAAGHDLYLARLSQLDAKMRYFLGRIDRRGA